MANKKLRSSLRKFSGQKEEKLVTITGELGLPLGGQKLVEVPGRDGFVYVRLKNNTSEVIQAYNSEVSTIYGLPVLVARQGNIYKVIGRNLDRYRDWSDIPYLPKHGGQHSFNFSLGMGADVSWIYSQQFMPLLSYPSGTQGSMTLSLEPHFYEWQGQWRYAQNTGTPSYAPYLPTITGSARMVLSYLDPTNNSIKLVPGTPFSNSLTGSAQIAQYIPDIPRSIGIPLAAVRLVTGTTAIGWGNIYDMRDFYTVSSGITGSTFGGIAVQDEGIPLGTGTVFNFVGSSVDASISGSVVRIFVTGSTFDMGSAIHNATGAGSNADADEFPFWNSLTLALAKITWLDIKNAIWTALGGLIAGAGSKSPPVDGDSFALSDSQASNASKRLSWANTKSALKTYFDTLYDPLGSAYPPITGSVVYQDDYVTKGSALVFNFRDGILASASGTNAQIDVDFGTGTNQVMRGNTPVSTSFELISDQILVSDATSFDFVSIPSTYKHLRLEMSLRSDVTGTSDGVFMRFNNDSGNNYDYIVVVLYTTTTFAEGLAQSAIWATTTMGNTAVASDFGPSYIDIMDYSRATPNKGSLSVGGWRGSTATNFIRLYNGHGHWRNTAAINRITIFPQTGVNWKTGSRATLFGVK